LSNLRLRYLGPLVVLVLAAVVVTLVVATVVARTGTGLPPLLVPAMVAPVLERIDLKDCDGRPSLAAARGPDPTHALPRTLVLTGLRSDRFASRASVPL
jgi:hypothetical protein